MNNKVKKSLMKKMERLAVKYRTLILDELEPAQIAGQITDEDAVEIAYRFLDILYNGDDLRIKSCLVGIETVKKCYETFGNSNEEES